MPDPDVIASFYDAHPYPPPVTDLEDYRRRWADPLRRRAEHLRYWPDRPYAEDLRVLIAGCGTFQAARHAIRRPAARVVGIDVSTSGIANTRRLKERHGLDNLHVEQMAIEDVGSLGETFDLVICTGVLHHLVDPEAGLRALAGVMAADGALHLMVYARHGRHGIDLLREYARRLDIGTNAEEVIEFAETLAGLPRDHPLGPLLTSPDFRRADAIADALLNPRETSYTVDELFELLAGAGLGFGWWLRQAPYRPDCGAIAQTPHARRLLALGEPDRSAAVELLRGTITRHSVVAHHGDRGRRLPGPADPRWLRVIPVPTPSTAVVTDRLPDGAAAVLINREHVHRDLVLPIDSARLRVLRAIDGRRTVGKLARRARLDQAATARFVHQLWAHDHVVLDLHHDDEREDLT